MQVDHQHTPFLNDKKKFKRLYIPPLFENLLLSVDFFNTCDTMPLGDFHQFGLGCSSTIRSQVLSLHVFFLRTIQCCLVSTDCQSYVDFDDPHLSLRFEEK